MPFLRSIENATIRYALLTMFHKLAVIVVLIWISIFIGYWSRNEKTGKTYERNQGCEERYGVIKVVTTMIWKQSFIYLIFIAKIKMFDYNIRQNNQYIYQLEVEFY